MVGRLVCISSGENWSCLFSVGVFFEVVPPSGVMVDPSFFGLALPSGGSGWPCLLEVWWLTLPLQVVFGPSFL